MSFRDAAGREPASQYKYYDGGGGGSARATRETQSSGGWKQQQDLLYDSSTVATVDSLEEQCRDSMRHTLRTAAETNDIAQATAQKLDEQGEQIDRIQRDADDISHNLNTTDYLLSGMRSWWGAMRQLVVSPPTTAPAAVPCAAVAQQPLSSWGSFFSGAPDSSWGSSTAAPRSPTATSRPTTFKSDSPSSGDAARGDIDDRWQRQLTAERPRAVKDFDMELEENLDELSCMLGEMHSRAIHMGESIQKQNKVLDSVHSTVEENNIRVTKQKRQIDELMGRRK